MGKPPKKSQYHNHHKKVNLNTNKGFASQSNYQVSKADQSKTDQKEAQSYLDQALIAHEEGNLTEAIAHYEKVLKIDKNCVKAYNNLAVIYCQQGNFKQAIGYLLIAQKIQPNLPDIYLNLGVAYHRHNDFVMAIQYLQLALQINPNYAEAYLNLGLVYKKQKLFKEAIAQYQKVIKLQPNFPHAYNSLGTVYEQIDQLELAIINYQQAIKIDPNISDFYLNLGLAYQAQSQIDQAINCYEKAIQLNFDQPKAHFNLATALLTKGELKTGWAEYEWRKSFIQKPEINQSLSDQTIPYWQGENLANKTLLIYAKQGFGDTIQFARFISLIKSRIYPDQFSIIFQCYEPLIQLLEYLPGIDQIIEYNANNITKIIDKKIDYQTPLMSLPHILGIHLDNIPVNIPYWQIPASPAIKNLIHSPDQPEKLLKIGLVWSGSPSNTNDHHRSCPLINFKSFYLIPNKYLQIYSLQKQISKQDERIFSNSPIIDLSAYLNNFLDTAQIIRELDLIITVDTAVAHLAGMMGKKTWVLLCFSPNWRWLLNTPHSPWYPTIKLFRQSQINDWSPVINQVITEINQLIKEII
jgi:tetratricopeptide (TPR) repeat protein